MEDQEQERERAREQRTQAMEEVKRIMRDEVRNDWIDLWEQQWRSSGGRGGFGGVSRVAAAGDTDSDDEGIGGESKTTDGGDENARGTAGEIWLHRGDDSDFLKAADVYRPSYPFSAPLARAQPPPPPQPQAYAPSSTSSSWYNLPRLGIPSLGGGSRPSAPSVGGSTPSNNYPSSSTTITTTAVTTPALVPSPQLPDHLPEVAPPQIPSRPSLGPYMFQSPDSIAPSIGELRERKRKELEEEMEWNEGLKCWIARRDAWTGADKEERVKVGRSKFADNPLTAVINENAYPAIYNKCVKRSVPPVVPINLRHVTNALVQGWKRDNEWPPSEGPPEPSFARRSGPQRGSAGGGGGGGGGGRNAAPSGPAGISGVPPGGNGGSQRMRRVLGML
ncbi:hypothetical protein BDZ91DRAFT_553597 [Kalaharituber pfeilii]|nr:hypothetical protein BDZ91DRAFT_553597 [Kalaharituber pfeilii]